MAGAIVRSRRGFVVVVGVGVMLPSLSCIIITKQGPGGLVELELGLFVWFVSVAVPAWHVQVVVERKPPGAV
jgi:hypothetical protein